MTEKDVLIEKHSVKSLFNKLDAIHAQTKMTNGRVNNLEKNPAVKMGNWATEHPLKLVLATIGITAVSLAVLISDFRHPIIEWLIKLGGFAF